MSRGPGKVERLVRELLNDPAHNSWSLKRLIREVFGLGTTEAQRVSVGRALRKVLIGNTDWRVSMERSGGHFEKTLIRERPAAANNDPVAIWGYRFTYSGIEWKSATIVRRTPTRRHIVIGQDKIVTDVYLKPIGEPSRFGYDGAWCFELVRSAQVETLIRQRFGIWKQAKRGEAGFGARVLDRTELARTLLNLGSSFTPEDVQRAFRAAMLRHHPDQGGDDAVARALSMARAALLS